MKKRNLLEQAFDKTVAEVEQPTAQHTKGEWKVGSFPFSKDLNYVCDSSGHHISCCQIGGERTMAHAEANAQRIVKAVNMHDELVEQIKTLLLWANIKDGSPSQYLRDEAQKLIDQSK